MLVLFKYPVSDFHESQPADILFPPVQVPGDVRNVEMLKGIMLDVLFDAVADDGEKIGIFLGAGCLLE